MDFTLECYFCHKHGDPFEETFTDMVLDGEYRPVCEKCYREHYFKCEHCGEDKKVEEKIIHNGKIYCRTCFDTLFVTCHDCGTVVRRGEARQSGRNFLCQECYRQGEILSNGYKPEPKFKSIKDENHNRYLGVELEIDGGTDPVGASKKVYKLTNKDSYNKHDGSLRGGFEIVTHPMTLEYHKKGYPWEKVMKAVQEDGFKSHSTKTCGLHIHFSRKALGTGAENDFNTMKMVMFFENNWDNLVNFSRRRPEALNSWARRFGVYDVKNQKDWEQHYKNAKGECNRYHAVNLTNRNTVEIRIFRGTLVPQTLYASLELIDLLTQKLPTLSFEETLRYDFKAVLKDAAHLSYNNLIEYCKSRGIPSNEKYEVVIPKIGDHVEICGRVVDFPINSGRANGLRGVVVRVRAYSEESELEQRAGGILVKFDMGEYWVKPSSLRVYNPEQTEREETVERKVD